MKKTLTFLSLLLGASANYADTLNGDSNVTGDLDIQDNLIVGGDATIDGTLSVNGETVWHDGNTETILRHNDYINPFNFTNGVKLYNTLTTNYLYQMDKRGTVTTSGFVDDSIAVSGLFTGYILDGSAEISDGQTATVDIDFPERITYGEGYIVVTTGFGRHAASITVRLKKDRLDSSDPLDGIVDAYTTIPEADDEPLNSGGVRYHIFPVPHSGNIYLLGLEITITGTLTNDKKTLLTEIEYHRPRPSQHHYDHSPLVTKYGPQTLIHNFSFKDSSHLESIKLEAETGKITAREFIGTSTDTTLSNSSGTTFWADDSNNVRFGDAPANLTGSTNFFFGGSAGESSTSGYSNIGFGSSALSNNTSGNNNLALGYQTLRDNVDGDNNIALGDGALAENKSGYSNIAIGEHSMGGAGYDQALQVYRNVGVGMSTLVDIIEGKENAALGYSAGAFLYYGSKNTYLGSHAGMDHEYGDKNVFIGDNAGHNLREGDGNIAIGAVVVFPQEEGSDQLNIGNTIYGDLANDKIGIGVAQPEENLHVNGTTKLDGDVEVTGNIVLAGPAGDISMGIFGVSQ